MIRFTVGPAPEGGWEVVCDRERPVYSEVHTFKFMAVLAAKKEAKTLVQRGLLPAVSVFVKDRKGRFQQEWTYPRSADPRSSKG